MHRGSSSSYAEKHRPGRIINQKIQSDKCSICGAWKGQLGLEPDFKLYIKHLTDIFDEVKRVLKSTGTCWVNLGDTYYTKGGSGFLDDALGNGNKSKTTGLNSANEIRGQLNLLPSKTLIQIPSRFGMEMSDRGWILRNKIIWHKKNCMPSSVKDRFTNDYEEIFFFVKSKKYSFEQQIEDSIWAGKDKRSSNKRNFPKEGKSLSMNYSIQGTQYRKDGKRNMRAVWKIRTKPHPFAHFAVYPEELIETPIKAGCISGG